MKPVMRLRGLIIALPIALAMWWGAYKLWTWVFGWIGGVR